MTIDYPEEGVAPFFDPEKHSLCRNVLELGFVTEEDYSDDVDTSEMWPAPMRNLYYTLSPLMVRKAYSSRWGYEIFLMTAYYYINAINGFDAIKTGKTKEYRRMIYWIPFLCGVVPGFLAGCVLWGLDRT